MEKAEILKILSDKVEAMAELPIRMDEMTERERQIVQCYEPLLGAVLYILKEEKEEEVKVNYETMQRTEAVMKCLKQGNWMSAREIYDSCITYFAYRDAEGMRQIRIQESSGIAQVRQICKRLQNEGHLVSRRGDRRQIEWKWSDKGGIA